MPRLLIEIVYKEGKNFHIGELHRYVKLQTDKLDEEIRSFEDYVLDLSKLYEAIEDEAQNIEKVLYMVDRNLSIKPDIPKGKVQWEKLSLER